MLRFLIARLGVLIPTFLGVTIVAFSLIRLIPGDPIELLVGERGLSAERHAQLQEQFGFDKPLWQQYLFFLGDLAQGDLGRSIVTRQPILKEFLNLFPATVELSLCALFIATIIGLPAGIIAGVNRGSTFDHALMGLSLTGYSMPIFWWALLLIIFFSGNLGWTPVSGRIDILYFFPPVTGFMLIDSLLSGQEGAFTSAVRHLILPAVVLGTIPVGGDRTSDPLGDARGAERGLRAHGARQGPAAVAGDRSACAEERADPGGHRDRPAGRPAVFRRDPDRDHLCLARDRQMAGRFDLAGATTRPCRAAWC